MKNKNLFKVFSTFLFVVLISFPAYSQKWKSLSKLSSSAWKALEGVLTLREIYNWVNEDKSVATYYVNPSGSWKSSSGNKFYITIIQGGLLQESLVDGSRFRVVNTGTMNFYSINFYNGNQFLYTTYYTVNDKNTITLNRTTGEEFTWTRIN